MIAKAFWISAMHTNTNSRRRLLRSYKAFVYCWSRTSRPRPSPTDATRSRRRRKRWERGLKRGKRRGIRARLRANPTRPALPTLMLSNVRSLENKLDLIQLSQSTQHEARDCMFVFTETWLKRQHFGLRQSAEQANLLPEQTEIHYFLVRPAEVACVCISTKNGVTMLR